MAGRIKYLQLIILSLFFSGCSIRGTFIANEYIHFERTEFSDDEILSRIIYLGDAGEPSAERREPLLQAVETQASLLADKTFIFFLGDNIYPSGLPEEGGPNRIEYERRLNEQISVIENSGTRGVFTAGNHDWDQGGRNGWQKLLNQVRFIEEKNNPDVVFLPSKGCPGPEAVDFGDNARIIFLDTQWWLHKYEKAGPDNSDCYPVDEEGILRKLDSLISTSGNRFVIIAAHHPLDTHGPHGGFFTWKAHLFPLTELNPYLWIPLPLIGSLYPIARQNGVTRQDLSNSTYRHMINKIEEVIVSYDDILIASGHEHSMQILRGKNNNLYTISGFGTDVHAVNTLTTGDNTIFAGFYPGFMQVDILKNGSIYLKVFRADPDYGISIEEFSMKLK